MVKLRDSIVDSWTNQDNTTKNYGETTRMHVRTTGGGNRYAWLFAPRPFPRGATIISATLTLYNGVLFSGSVTLTAQRASAKWSVNRINYNNQPGVTGTTATRNLSSAAAGTAWDFDVATQLQAVADGAAWYGWRISTSASAVGWLHSAQATRGLRPILNVTWSVPPEEPSGLSPSGDRVISDTLPLFRAGYVDLDEDPLASMQVQISRIAGAWSAPLWDSGEVATVVPELDLGTVTSSLLIVNTTNASTTITSPNTGTFNSAYIGNTITGANIPGGATITAVASSTSATISAAATGTASNTVATVNEGPYSTMLTSTVQYWRCRLKDSAGVWSPWSNVSGGEDGFLVIAKNALTITSPSAGSPFFWSGSPTITWTFTGQESYQVIIAKANNNEDWLWDSGKITSTDQTLTVPFGAIKDASATYTVIVRVWDTQPRENIPGDPAYVEASRNVTFNYDSTVAEVTSLNMASDPLYPIAHLTWNRSTQPTAWQIQRSSDAGVTWQYVAEALGSDLFVSGTSYAYDDTTAASYESYTWRALAVVGNVQSGDNPTTNGEVRRLAPWLMRPDGTDAVVFLNPQRSRQYANIQELHEYIGGPPVVVTQKLGMETGSVRGEFADDIITGVTAKMMKNRFNRIREDAGATMIVSIADEQFEAVPYNMQIDTLTHASGISYLASFDWVRVS
jgi:hypothetical protein